MAFAKTNRLTTDGAKQMMAAAIDKAKEHGVAATVVIVDGGGHVILVERMDGGRFHTVHSSTTKAITASSNKRPTTTKGAVGQELDTLHAIGLALAAGPERWTAMEGIGVSGGNWEADQEIAEVAVKAIGASTTV
jgi:glc operon protein GlcG